MVTDELKQREQLRDTVCLDGKTKVKTNLEIYIGMWMEKHDTLLFCKWSTFNTPNIVALW